MKFLRKEKIKRKTILIILIKKYHQSRFLAIYFPVTDKLRKFYKLRRTRLTRSITKKSKKNCAQD